MSILIECSRNAQSLNHNKLDKQWATLSEQLISHLGTYVGIKAAAGC